MVVAIMSLDKNPVCSGVSWQICADKHENVQRFGGCLQNLYPNEG